jgi:hypothetical protein
MVLEQQHPVDLPGGTMSPRIRKATAVLSAAALLGGGGLSAAQAASGDGGSRPARSGPGRGHVTSAQLAKIAATLGVSTAQLQAALTAARPARPTGARGADGMAGELATALGVTTAQVQTILDANRPARPAAGTRGTRPPRGARPANTKLIAALADGLNLDTATVTAAFDKIEEAHRAAHTAGEAAMYAAVAARLGLSSDAVKAAFEANRPAKPAAA